MEQILVSRKILVDLGTSVLKNIPQRSWPWDFILESPELSMHKMLVGTTERPRRQIGFPECAELSPFIVLSSSSGIILCLFSSPCLSSSSSFMFELRCSSVTLHIWVRDLRWGPSKKVLDLPTFWYSCPCEVWLLERDLLVCFQWMLCDKVLVHKDSGWYLACPLAGQSATVTATLQSVLAGKRLRALEGCGQQPGRNCGPQPHNSCGTEPSKKPRERT